MIRRRWLAVAAISGLLLASAMQGRYDATVNYFGDRSAFVSLPSGKALQVLSFGYRNLAADLLFIWSIQFYSTYNITNRFDFLERIYNAITDITPSYREPYLIGSLIMVLEAKDVPMALRLLEKGSRQNPGEWIFDNDAGYYSYKYLKDYKRAERYFTKAAAKPDAPDFIKRMKAHMVYMSDDPQTAYRMWLDLYRNAGSVLEKDSARNHLYQIKAENDLAQLQAKIAEFRQRFQRYPAALADLARSGFIRDVPRDFYGKEYVYDPRLGTVSAQRTFRWKKH